MSLAASVSTPPLLEGDSLTSEEFLRRWDEIPDLKRVELIDDIVCMPSPVSLKNQEYQSFVNGWLSFYAASTPGCRPAMEGTWLMGERQVPQPDTTLRILPEYGGQSGVEGLYPSGAPELIVEVAVSSRSGDFGARKRLYEQVGVREYAIVLPVRSEMSWFELTESGFQPVQPGADGIFRSRCFPGLWLDINALWALDLPGMNSVLQQGLATPGHAAFVAQSASAKLLRASGL